MQCCRHQLHFPKKLFTTSYTYVLCTKTTAQVRQWALVCWRQSTGNVLNFGTTGLSFQNTDARFFLREAYLMCCCLGATMTSCIFQKTTFTCYNHLFSYFPISPLIGYSFWSEFFCLIDPRTIAQSTSLSWLPCIFSDAYSFNNVIVKDNCQGGKWMD